jgi:MoaA/NifB/PqqE/SkfB family radical SAM enzyme
MTRLFSILGIGRPPTSSHDPVQEDFSEIAKDLFSQNVKEVNIELSNFCNRQCSHCPREQVRKKDARNINRELLEKILAELSSINFSGTIHTHLYNEPLYDPEYWIACYDIIKQRLPNCKVGIATNGDYLNADLLSTLISMRVDTINVTLYYTVWDEAKQFGRLTQYLKRLGVDGNVTSAHYGIYFKREINQTALHVRSVNFEKTGQDRGGALTEGVNRIRRSTPCSLPRTQFNINFDGEVFPCCNILPRKENNAEYMMGSVRDKSLFQIYSATELAQFKRIVEAINGEESEMPNCCRFCSENR